jgi:hypothetical protein
MFSKGEDFFNGGLLKSRQANVNSIYGEPKRSPIYKSEDIKSGIHISDEQLNEAGVDKKDQGGDETANEE